jgi:hypothetical protein
VAAPFIDLVSHFAERWWPEIGQPGDNEALLKGFLEDLYDRVSERRDAVVALVSARGDPEAHEAVRQAQARLDRFFAELNSMAVARAQGFPGQLSPLFVEGLTTRFVVGLVVLATAFEPWFIPQGAEQPSKREVIDTMARFVLHGVMEPTEPPASAG